MARIRHQISFRQDDPRHRQALGFLHRQAHASEYVIDCILKAEQQNLLKATIKEAIGECLGDMQIAASPVQIEPQQAEIPIADAPPPDIADINPSLLAYLENPQND